ncbi:MAG: hypothetical protein L0Z51_07850 [Candidatus Latescibacteria bacterium]|nr:hypothetical protein [Candidatus Latescibacterota bacterium]
MDLRGLFEKTLQRAPYEYAADVIERKLDTHGIKLTTKQRKELVRRLQSGDPQLVRLQAWKFWDRRTVDVNPSEEDITEIEKRLEDLTNRIPDIAMAAVEDISPKMRDVLMRAWLKEGLRNQQECMKGASAEVWSIWREPLEILWLMIDLADRSAENV